MANELTVQIKVQKSKILNAFKKAMQTCYFSGYMIINLKKLCLGVGVFLRNLCLISLR